MPKAFWWAVLGLGFAGLGVLAIVHRYEVNLCRPDWCVVLDRWTGQPQFRETERIPVAEAPPPTTSNDWRDEPRPTAADVRRLLQERREALARDSLSR